MATKNNQSKANDDFTKYFESNFKIKVNNHNLFDQALTHNSYANEKKKPYTYQRLEFLGDAILQKHMSLYFYKNLPKIDEGKLTKERSNAVREETLASVTKQIGLNRFIRLGNGEEASGGREKPSILADVFESTTAAIYLDNEDNNPDEVIKKWLKETLIKYISEPEYLDSIRDYKSELQELLQAENRNDLQYVVKSQKSVENNNIEYIVDVKLDNQTFGEGKGYSKQHAEQEAAKNCLNKLRVK
ncbi:ribonuclease III [Mesoplasma lactucae]|uniref:Ribonuclease 3 n=1 Tax=Mesoplasma lactucae ATCC 49193 TaxID=81460 RepID=A0A291IRZ5_9MOLU|nr:ribonuclease III [Mesoplasma lactucae]ATG97530.1 ribonuclease III [Mesoplasma lactucae ATCC 49193]ATZ20012.1 ribonuclease III [Mesoplasma lactucae ATCC 49193]MCL8217037.1 Ribonuclease 3 [Mesoplasma lactucae ATCC 49193]